MEQQGPLPAGVSPRAVTLHDTFLAARRIAPHIRATPLEYSGVLSAELGGAIWLKLESQQRTGSFKLRGALNRLLTLSPDVRARGVLTCSAGNHGLGVAEAARLTGTRATIVVPENASPAKVDALRRTGVELLLVGEDYDAAEARAPGIAAERCLPFISPYDDPLVIAGASTVALEIVRDLPEVGTILVPVGGGGLASGIGVAAKGINPAIRVVGVQSEASPSMIAALAAGVITPVVCTDSLADGLAGNIAPGSITFPLVRDYLDEVVAVPETAIEAAMRAFLTHHHMIVEGSGAVGLAALQTGRLRDLPSPIALIVSGSNVASSVLTRLLA